MLSPICLRLAASRHAPVSMLVNLSVRSLAPHPRHSRGYASKKNSASYADFSTDQAGLVTDIYCHPRSLPSWFSSPKLRWTALKRRLQAFGMNTYMAVKTRKDIGSAAFQPLEWKETALLLYTRMNECFVKRDMQGLSQVVSRWVYGPLSTRSQKLPKNYAFNWQLVRYKSRPKVMSIIPLTVGDEPSRYVQMVYRIESVQRLAKTKLGSDKVESSEQDVCDNVAFIFDTRSSPVRGRVIGSLFDTPANAPMPDLSSMPKARHALIDAMSIRGDIFREPPNYAVLKKGSS